MARFRPSIDFQVGGIPAYLGTLVAPPLAWLTTGAELNGASTHAINEGRYHHEGKTVKSVSTLKREWDTYITGTSGRTGTAFSVVAGGSAWKDDYKHPIYNAWGLGYSDGAPGTAYEVVTTSNLDPGVPECELLLHRGFPGVSTTASHYTAANCYLRLTFGYGNQYQWRLRLEYGRPIGLDVSYNSGVGWFTPAWASKLGNVEEYLKAHHNEVRLKFSVDPDGRHVRVEIGNGQMLRFGLPESYKGELSRPGKLRIEAMNGELKVYFFPSRHGDIAIERAQRDFGAFRPNWQQARLELNTTGSTPPNQTQSVEWTGDGTKLGYKIRVTQPDAGDGLGSEKASYATDATVHLPALWAFDVDGLPDFRYAQLPTAQVIETQVWNPIERTRRAVAQVINSNARGELDDLVGNLACVLNASNGWTTARRITGISTAPRFYRADPKRLQILSVSDCAILLMQAINEEVQFDGWCVYSAVRFVCECCGIHPMWLQTIPAYPYGQAGYDCPFPILGRGSGGNPKYKYEPNITGWAILLELVQDQSEIDPFTGLPVSYYMGFDPFNQFHFEPVFYFERQPVFWYSDSDTSGHGMIVEGLEWAYATDNLRTVIDIQGMDDITGELLHVHREMGVGVRRMVGHRSAMFLRSDRFVNLPQMEAAADGMTIPASIPELVGAFRAVFQPLVSAGDVVGVFDKRRGAILCVIEKMRSIYGIRNPYAPNGYQDCYSDIQVRALANYF